MPSSRAWPGILPGIAGTLRKVGERLEVWREKRQQHKALYTAERAKAYVGICSICKETIYSDWDQGRYFHCQAAQVVQHLSCRDRDWSSTHGHVRCEDCGENRCESEIVDLKHLPICKACLEKEKRAVLTSSGHRIEGFRILQQLGCVTATHGEDRYSVGDSAKVQAMLIRQAFRLGADGIVDLRFFPQGRNKIIGRGNAVKLEKAGKEYGKIKG